ncbi:Ribonuclease E [Methyloligella halotolerans]|uniref:Ribonuclease E n=1 Tax=Methyloligella halotolerans TaxID=1177755 RepID=A0A1E2S2T7_9HYPH|nr:ribonuclease E/G [Methyloligella halotolerans]ODA68833.1 Ribonuclease E [Methyloligella halotolerans]
MPSKMLIDAAHPEETRVVVVKGNRVEEFDYESANRKQLRGNIYLAKVTRVEPSLQAAFVDYGGNRHGFLAFNEIHPDYYQIPVADRQALLEEEAEEQSRVSAQEAAEDDAAAGKRKPRRRSRGKKDENQFEADSDRDEDESSASHDDDADDYDDENDEENGSDIMLAKKDLTHEISEEAPPPNSSDENDDDSDESDESDEDDETSEAQASSDHGESTGDEEHDESSEGGNRRRRGRGGRGRGRGRSTAKSAKSADKGDEKTGEGESVESVGSEDAMEEVPERARRRRRSYKIQEVIRRRQIILVQVVKEERGNKGAALTTYLSLAGRYTVLMPNTARGGGISRKITQAPDRKRLREIADELEVPEGMGLIIRTAGAQRTKAEVKRDYDYLLRLWETVRDLTLESTAPTLVYEEGSLIKRSIRDLYNKDIDEVLVAGEDGYRDAKDFMRMLMPSHAKNVKLYKEPDPLFIKYKVERQLAAMFSPQVTLKSGGYIVINQTEALVAIDVNSGKATREHNIEDTALQTNLEAAEEIARQLRLRDLAGLIVIDFIDMDERRNNRNVEKRLKDSLRNDRARIQVGRISAFGLLEMSRQRLRTGMLEGSTTPCPVCQGTGAVRSIESVALDVLRSIEDKLITEGVMPLAATTAPDVALYILNQKRAHLKDIEHRYDVPIMITAGESLHGANFTIERMADTEMSVGDAAVVQMDWAHHQPSSSEDEESSGDGRNKRSRRRRRRRRGGSDQEASDRYEGSERYDSSDRYESSESDEPSHDDEAVSARSDDSSEDDEDQPKKPRRRGRRGGRRGRGRGRGGERSAADQESGETDDESQEDGHSDDSKSDDARSDDVHADDAAEEPKKSGRKTREETRPEVTPVTASDDDDIDEEESAEETPPQDEPELAAQEASAQSNGFETEQAASPASEDDEKASDRRSFFAKRSQASTEVVLEDEDEDRPQRRGWWQR